MNPNIVFIVLNSAVKSRIVCDLAEKCFLNNKRIVIYIEKEEECKLIDALLWTWKQQSFVPHKYLETLVNPQMEPVILTTGIEESAEYEILLMYDPLPMEIIKKFTVVIDFAEKYDSNGLQLSRDRYKIYRDHNFEINTMQPGEFLHTALQ